MDDWNIISTYYILYPSQNMLPVNFGQSKTLESLTKYIKNTINIYEITIIIQHIFILYTPSVSVDIFSICLVKLYKF
jgi:hypothetical protein